LRHRRRYNTQTIQKKKRSTVSYPAYPKKKNASSKVFSYFVILVVLAGLTYVGTVYVIPWLTDLWPDTIGTETSGKQTDKPQFPVEEEPEPVTEYRTPIPEMIQVEVLNGCGESGIAKFLADKLREANYDVVNMGNYIEGGKPKWDVELTRLIDQIGHLDKARKLGEVMGVDYAQVETFENPSPIADITIIIGKDYSTLKIFKDRP
jgi:hypothetical protein